MKKTIILTFFVLVSGIIYSQGLNGIFSTSLLNVYSVGNNGVFLKSTNAGSTYSSAVISPERLNSVFGINTFVWVCGSNGKFYRSADIAETWMESTVSPGVDLYSVFFTDVNTGFVCGNGGRIFKTTDGGVVWSSLNSGAGFDLKGVKFSDASTGYCFGESSILLKTTDGGSNWSQMLLPFDGKIRSFDVSGGIMIAGGSYDIYLRSTDNGFSWISTSLKIQSLPSIVSVEILTPQTYVLLLESGSIWKTTNGGLTFTFGRNDFRDAASSMCLFNYKMYLCGKYNTVVARSTDEGNSWSLPPSTTFTVSFEQLFTPGMYSFNRVLDMNYQARGVLFSLVKNKLYRTLNMGVNWSLLSEFQVDPVVQRSTQLVVNMKDSSKMIAAVNSQNLDTTEHACRLYRTTNYGMNWQNVFKTDNDFIGNFISQDPQHPDTLFMGIRDSVFRSTNFGLNWSKIATWGFDDWCDIAVSYDNSQVIYGSTNHHPARLCKSTNGGYNWFMVDMVSDTGFCEMPCIALSNLAPNMILHAQKASNSNQTGLKRSYTQGNSWLFSQFTGDSWAIDVAKDDPALYAYGSVSYDPIFLSTNSGGNFVGTPSKYAEQLLYYDRANLFVNDHGTISKMKITYNMPVIGIQNIAGNVPKEYGLGQNYPNPFNPVTNIQVGVHVL
ncbi:MAG: hypothetical protein IAE90_15400, partial [Ignavibacteria bacterium]|nr:hypothetical protein [Ignavibacteria bacterium]